MRELRVTEVDDHGRLVLVHGEERFVVVVDDELRSAVRRASAANGAEAPPTPPTPPVSLAPRDVQARVRAGETVAAIAEEAGVPPERVEPYARPVLDERRHHAERVQDTSLAGAVGRVPLHVVVTDRLTDAGVEVDALSWDVWRSGAGWVAAVRWDGGEARWAYDPPGPTVEPLDDPARWLLTGRGRPPDGIADPADQGRARDASIWSDEPDRPRGRERDETGRFRRGEGAGPPPPSRPSVPSWDEILLHDRRDAR